MVGRSKHRQIPSDFRLRALRDDIKAVRAHFRIGHEVFYRWCEELGIRDAVRARRPSNHIPKPIPADFAEHAAEPNASLRERYPGVSASLFVRWRKIVGVVVTTAPGEAAPEGFSSRVATMHLAQACRAFGRSEAVIKRWCHETGARPKPWAGFSAPKPAMSVDHRASDLAGQAQRHLQRHLQRLMPVVKASIIVPKRAGYVVGGRHMATEEMIAMAQAKGFDPDAWRRI